MDEMSVAGGEDRERTIFSLPVFHSYMNTLSSGLDGLL